MRDNSEMIEGSDRTLTENKYDMEDESLLDSYQNKNGVKNCIEDEENTIQPVNQSDFRNCDKLD